MLKITGKRGVSLARRHLPIIYQGFDSFYDIPTQIELGDFKPTPKPSCYYWVRCDEIHYYLGYAFYHYRDWTSCIPTKPFDEHRHDFEGVLIQVPYYLPHNKPKPSAKMITVHHHEFKTETYDDDAKPTILIEAQSHAINPCEPSDLSNSQNYILTNNIRLVNIDSLGETWFETMKTIFAESGVNMPDGWEHHGKYVGWMWNQPDDLMKVMFSE